MADVNNDDRRDTQRISIKAEIEFFVSADLIVGETLNVSKSGVGFSTKSPLEIELRIVGTEHADEPQKARLVWARQTIDGGCTYGFEYVSTDDSE